MAQDAPSGRDNVRIVDLVFCVLPLSLFLSFLIWFILVLISFSFIHYHHLCLSIILFTPLFPVLHKNSVSL